MSIVDARKTHELVNTTEPNLLEDVFDYNLPPRSASMGR